jgi:hypothetical protein
VAHLLQNPSAQIREETLDRIVDKARDVELWHEPLVSRRGLSAKMMERLARFVAYNLLEVLLERHDLDLETAEEVRKEFNRRLAEDSKPEIAINRKAAIKNKSENRSKPQRGGKGVSARESSREPVQDKARRMNMSGELDASVVMGALQSGELDFVMASLSEISDLPLSIIDKISSTASAKGIISVAWKSGLTMSEAVKLQRKLIRLQPRDIIHAATGGKFPLSEEEMSWQLDFFKDLSGRG